MRLRSVILLALGSIAAVGCAAKKEPADLVLRNGKIVTVDSTTPEAQAIAVKGDRILAVGSNREIAAHVGSGTRVIDLKGQLAVPGLIEGHGHFMYLGEAKLQLNLGQVKNWGDVVGMVKAAASDAPAGAWILGQGWHQEKWDTVPADAVEGVPVHASLDSVSANHPVLLSHASGHAAFANGAALRAAGITRGTRNPPGGEIVRDKRGDATGYLKEEAQNAPTAAMQKWRDARPPEVKEAELLKMVELAGQDALSKGVTSFQDAGADFQTITLFKQLAEAGKLPIRLYVMVWGGTPATLKEKLAQYRMIGIGNEFLTVRSIKLVADGALGSRGAWLLKPYEDLKTSAGLPTESVSLMTQNADIAMANDFQVNTHAIGDRANREVLDIYQRLMEAHPDKNDLRWRIEHAQHIDPQDIPRFGQLGVIASMQAVHATSDGPWVPKRLGDERTKNGAYVWQSLMKSGAVVTNGTDAPVEDVDPIASFYATVARKFKDGTVFYPEQRMSRMEALRSYTINNAYAAFEEAIKGSLTPGKLADITVRSRDILTIPEDEIPTAKVTYTIVGGKVAYRGAP